ncbi:FMN-binding negative transcriptional regulator [uncultured Croceitalea sp.]|uniref:FMN-binding negative transcriptional regulator n=1 Tax=uncultured Croceitalea sp. TaxID=1798908 RepID=UPI0033060989
MYTPQSYKNEDLKEVKQFLKENSFGMLISQVNGKPWATHIPLELDVDEAGNDVLISHMAKANQQWKTFKPNEEVLCIFNGPHAYISSSWYKEEEVPTWNYIAVHVYGKIQILDEKAVLQSMHKLVQKYEQHSKNPISLDNMSEKTLRQVKGVVGFKIEITDIQATYKLSQGRPEDHSAIVNALEKRKSNGDHAVAKHIKKMNTFK